jgi:trk system potassium uptake protein TrkH
MRRRILPILKVLSMVIGVFGLSMLLPLFISQVTDDQAQMAYDEAVVGTLALAGALWLVSGRSREELKPRDGYLLVVLIWTLMPLLASLPLLIYLPDLTFTDAYFETMSGLTTTGATVLSGLDDLPPSINVWRAQLHLIGGMGVIVLVVAVLPLLGIGGRQMFKAETPGPMKDTKLTPRMTETAKGLWVVYLIATSACFLLFHFLGMGWIDALVHAFSVMGLGGFSSHDASFGHFDSVPMELVAMGFALFAGMNFATHFLALHHRSLGPYRVDPEIRWFLGIVLGSCLMLALYLWSKDAYLDFPSALRYASFNTISMATSLGLATADFNAWPYFAGLWLLFLCSFSTSAGSTGGGIKMMRAILLYQQVFREIAKALHPQAELPMRLGETVVPNKIMYAVLAFAFVYMASVVSLLFRHRRLRQQHGPGAGPGGPRHHLRRAQRLPDLGVHLRHAPGPAGTLHPAGGALARLLEEMTAWGFTISASTEIAHAPRQRHRPLRQHAHHPQYPDPRHGGPPGPLRPLRRHGAGAPDLAGGTPAAGLLRQGGSPPGTGPGGSHQAVHHQAGHRPGGAGRHGCLAGTPRGGVLPPGGAALQAGRHLHLPGPGRRVHL